MIHRLFILAGLVSGVITGFLIAPWAGAAFLTAALLFIGWASIPTETPHGPV